MRRKLSFIILVLIILMTITTNSYAASSTPIESIRAGDRIVFADREWIILDPSVGFIILASDIGKEEWNKVLSDNYATSHIRRFLNNNFLSTLGSENEELIIETIWNCGGMKDEDDYYEESSKRVRDKVGMLTFSEYMNYRSMLGSYKSSWWLITSQKVGYSTKAWTAHFNDVSASGVNSQQTVVRPALYLKSGLLVSKVTYDGNENDGGSVPVDNKNYLRNTTVTAIDNTGTLTKTGYDFVGWNTEADGSGIDYIPGSTFKMEDKNITLYAKWKLIETVNISNISDVTAPVKGGTPSATITETDQYTGTVSWSPVDSQFKGSTIYTATISLTSKAGYTLTGIPENFFTLAGVTAATVTNSENSGVVTAVFQETAPNNNEKEIKSFELVEQGGLPIQVGLTIIDKTNNTVVIKVVNGTTLKNLIPTITVSDEATISPDTGVAQDFNNTVTYTVTAEDGTTSTWKVTVKEVPLKSISSYSKVTLNQTGDITHNNVQYKTETEVISALPSSITVTLEDGSKASIPLSWVDTDSYDSGKSGEYTFTATWGTLPNGIDNDDNIEAPKCEVNVAQNSTEYIYVPKTKSTTQKTSDKIKEAKPNSQGIIQVTTEVTMTNEGRIKFILPKNFLGNNPVELTIETENIQTTLSSTMFTGKEKQIELVMEPSNKDDLGLSDEARNLIGNMPVYNIYLKIDGQKVDWQGDEDISITMKLGEEAENKDGHKFVVVYYDRDGNIQILKSSYYSDGRLHFTTKHLSDYGVIYVDKHFTDTDNHWSKEAVEALAVRGVIEGTTDTTFTPHKNITRADFVTLIVRYFNFEGNTTDNFTDVKSGIYYSDKIAIAKDLGILPMIDGNKFRPHEAITRQDMMVILYNALKVSGESSKLNKSNESYKTFNDSDEVPDYAIEATDYLISTGIINGTNNNINPNNTTTRAEVAQMLYNMLIKLNENN